MTSTKTWGYDTYSSGLETLCQQMTARTRDTVTIESKTGERVGFDQIGDTELEERNNDTADLPLVDFAEDRRWMSNIEYSGRKLLGRKTKLEILNDPMNAYSQGFAYAGARRLDRTVIQAALAATVCGKKGEDKISLPASQIIVHGGTGFTLTKLKKGVELLKRAEALMPGDTLHCMWTAGQEHEFIDTTEVKSSDFNNAKVMVGGELQAFFGVNFRRLEDTQRRHPKTKANSVIPMLPKTGTVRRCIMWVKSGIKLNITAEMFGEVDWLPEKQAWQASATFEGGAVRMQEDKVVVIEVQEA
jgi:hypothetical protein